MLCFFYLTATDPILEKRKRGTTCGLGIHIVIRETIPHAGQVLVAVALFSRKLRRSKPIVVDTANDQRQLSSQMRRFLDRQTVAQRLEHGPKYPVRLSFIVEATFFGEVDQPCLGLCMALRRFRTFVSDICAPFVVGRVLVLPVWPLCLECKSRTCLELRALGRARKIKRQRRDEMPQP